MKVRVSAVYEQSGEILCMKYLYGGKEVFSLPGGGVEKDMPLQEVLAKEWGEELGIKVDIGDVILVGEAPAGKQYPRTLHLIFEVTEILGIPKVQQEATCSLDVIWIPIKKLPDLPLYPDVGKQLYAYFTAEIRKSLTYISNCMKRGYW